MSKRVTASLICMDLCNLEHSVVELEKAGCEMLHVDLLDGYFSPSMPIGIDTIKQLRTKTNMLFDVHIMAMDNTFFIEELADIGIEQMCFQVETERHISKKLAFIKSKGIKAGVALAPSTAISTLEYTLEQCDFVLLMMINPGFASSVGEKPLESLKRKIIDLSDMILKHKLNTKISIDGRTYLEKIPEYTELGASTFVGGTSGLFLKNGKTLKENFQTMDTVIKNVLEKKIVRKVIFYEN